MFFPFFVTLLTLSFALSVVVKNPLLVILAVWLGVRWQRNQNRRREATPARHRTARRSTPSRRAHAEATAAVRESAALDREERRAMLSNLDEGLAQVDALRDATRRLAESEDPRLAYAAEEARARRLRFDADCRRVVTTLAALQVQGHGAEALQALTRATDDLANRVAARAEINALAS